MQVKVLKPANTYIHHIKELLPPLSSNPTNNIHVEVLKSLSSLKGNVNRYKRYKRIVDPLPSNPTNNIHNEKKNRQEKGKEREETCHDICHGTHI